MLNSNENFEVDDTFNLSFVHVRAGPYGGMKPPYLPGHQASTRLKVIKKTVISIPQTDENLCSARATVTALAKAENYPKWRSVKRGFTIQQQEAIHFHRPLTFPLCRTCVQEQLDLPLHDKTWRCSHTPDQRALTGTWCTPELQKAVEKGYVLLTIHEVWHFPQSQQGLFAEYVNTWLKIKEEASGWPAGCTTQ